MINRAVSRLVRRPDFRTASLTTEWPNLSHGLGAQKERITVPFSRVLDIMLGAGGLSGREILGYFSLEALGSAALTGLTPTQQSGLCAVNRGGNLSPIAAPLGAARTEAGGHDHELPLYVPIISDSHWCGSVSRAWFLPCSAHCRTTGSCFHTLDRDGDFRRKAFGPSKIGCSCILKPGP